MSPKTDHISSRTPQPSGHWLLRGSVALALVLLALAFLRVVVGSSAEPPARLSAAVYEHLDASGVENPVTAVLLNFRAWDTLLELVVLTAAVVGIWSLPKRRAPRATSTASPVLDAVVGLLVPLMVLIGAYLLWKGIYGAGGAFQSGAVLAAVAVLLLLAGRPALPAPAGVVRSAAVVGPLVFVAVGLGGLAVGAAFLQYPRGWAGWTILIIELTSTVSIAVLLAAAFAGSASALLGASPREESR